MSLLREWTRRLAGTFRRGRSDADLQEELRSHLEIAAESDRHPGEPAAHAARLAVIRHGGVAQAIEAQRDQRGLSWLTDLVRDAQYAWRQLRKNPGFTAVALVSLALGIGGTTAVFSLANDVFLKPLPGIQHPEELVLFRWDGQVAPDPHRFNTEGAYTFSPVILERFRDRGAPLADLFAFAWLSRLTASIDGQPEVVPLAQLVSGNYFAGLDVGASLGRAIGPADETSAAAPVALVSHRYWWSRFAGDPGVIGKTVWLNRVSLTIVGVTPADFAGTVSFGASPDFFVPLGLAPRLLPAAEADFSLRANANWWLRIMARLRPGATAAQLRARLEPVFQQAALEGATSSRRWSLRGPVDHDGETPRLFVEPGGQGLHDVRLALQPMLTTLTGIVGTVLLVACVNLASLLLSRSSARAKEMGVRLALGAGRGRLVRQLLTESLLLSSLGAALGILLAAWANDLFRFLIAEPGLDLDVSIDGRVLGFTGAIAMLTGLSFGLLPAWRATRREMRAGFPSRGRSRVDRVRSSWAKGLMVAQVALSLVLLVGEGLFVRTLRNLHIVDPGFGSRNLVLFEADAVATGHSSTEATMLYRQIAESIAALPGVEDATFSDLPVLSGSSLGAGIGVPGFNRGQQETVSANGVGPEFFSTLQIPVLFGRGLEPRDESADKIRRVLVVNQSFARKFFGQEDVIGRRTDWGDIIGVVRDIRDTDLKRIEPVAYVPFQHAPFGSWTGARANFAVRALGISSAIVPAIRRAVQDIDPNLPLNNLRTQDEQIGRLVSQERLFAEVAGFLSFLAAGSVCIGLYGLVSYSVQRRTNEIGVRMALGASPLGVLGLMLRESLWLVTVGLSVGLAGAIIATRFMATFLYGLSSTDPLTYSAAALVLVSVAFLACLLPARRAARIDPVIALRSE